MDPITQTAPPKKSYKTLVLGLIAASLVVTGGVVATILLLTLSGVATPTYKTYKTTSVGDKTGQKVSLSYPDKMTQVSNQGAKAEYADYRNSSKKEFFSDIDISGEYTGTITAAQITIIKNVFKNKTDGYQQTLDQIQKGATGDVTDLRFSDFKDFSSNGVKDGLQADFNYKGRNSGKKGNGRLVLAFGKQNLYSVTLIAEEKVWVKNTAAWDKVISSFAVDQ